MGVGLLLSARRKSAPLMDADSSQGCSLKESALVFPVFQPLWVGGLKGAKSLCAKADCTLVYYLKGATAIGDETMYV